MLTYKNLILKPNNMTSTTGSIRNEVAKNIRLLRVSKGWTQEYLAQKLDISTAACSKIENGYIDINVSRLLELRDIFQIKMTELLSVNDKAPDSFNSIKNLIKERDQEIVRLQKLLISLHEEIKNKGNQINTPNISAA